MVGAIDPVAGSAALGSRRNEGMPAAACALDCAADAGDALEEGAPALLVAGVEDAASSRSDEARGTGWASLAGSLRSATGEP
jgi:hypothetical protein